MKLFMKKALFWTPRLLGLLFAAFISLFAMDVFGESRGFWQTALALVMHLIPTGILLLLLAVSWRWDWVGGVVFPALGLLYIAMFWGRFHWSSYAVIAGPLILIGTLFFVSWRGRKNIQPLTPV
jgi:hypothetical protein